MCVCVGERKWGGGHGSYMEQHSAVFTTSSTRINSLTRMILRVLMNKWTGYSKAKMALSLSS